MARTPRTRSSSKELPPPLPPERRTVGQLIAESIRLYGANFLRALPLGLFVAALNQVTIGLSRVGTSIVFLLAAPLFSLSYAYATQLVAARRVPNRTWITACVVGTITFLPAALAFPWFALASVAWLALVGLSVPAAIFERASIGDSLRRGLRLGRVDYVHAAGSLSALVVLFALSRYGLALVLHSQAENAIRTAVFLADAVVAPLLFIGSAMLYVDQEARLRSRANRGEERDGDLPDAHDPDGEGRPDAPRESGSPA
jgi:hypothetical protein